MAIGRSDSLQDLITILESIYSETIIGSDINLVKHLFYYLKADDREFDFIYEEKVNLAIVEDILNDTVQLSVPNFQQTGHLRGRIRFEIMNILYQFEVIIIEIRHDSILIKIPTELQSMQLRQSKRLLVDDLFMNFIILFRSLAGGTRSVGKNLYAERRFPFLMKEIRKDKPNLKLINIMITDYIKSVSKDFEIVIYKKNEELDPFEKFIRNAILNTNKSIYISDCNKLERYIEPYEDEVLTNLSSEFHKLIESTSELESLSFFESLQKKRKSRILCKLYLFCSSNLRSSCWIYKSLYYSDGSIFNYTSSGNIYP